ncbi:MAG: hypothetical protein COB67_09045, partial [SAR324 cluster bacterium]
MSLRVFELAKELDTPTKEFLKRISRLGIQASGNFSALSEKDINRIRTEFLEPASRIKESLVPSQDGGRTVRRRIISAKKAKEGKKIRASLKLGDAPLEKDLQTRQEITAERKMQEAQKSSPMPVASPVEKIPQVEELKEKTVKVDKNKETPQKIMDKETKPQVVAKTKQQNPVRKEATPAETPQEKAKETKIEPVKEGSKPAKNTSVARKRQALTRPGPKSFLRDQKRTRPQVVKGPPPVKPKVEENPEDYEIKVVVRQKNKPVPVVPAAKKETRSSGDKPK